MAAAFFTAVACAAQDHVVERSSLRKVPASLSLVQKMIDDAARKYHGQDVMRIVLFDAAAGGTQAEHDAIAGGALVLVVAMSQDSGELPLKRVYVPGETAERCELLKIGILPKELVRALEVPQGIGQAVWVALYFIPLARRLTGPLRVDFARNREDFELGTIDPQMFRDYKETTGTVELNLLAIKMMAQREYPGVDLDPAFLASVEALRGRAH